MLQFSDAEKEEFREIFGLVDTDGSGRISPAELGQLTKKLGLKYTEAELENFIREIDIDRSGEIDFDEFLAVMSRQVQPAYSPAELIEAFKLLCDDENNHITMKALENILCERTTEKLSRDKAKKLLQQLDPDGKGEIDFVEFVNVMTYN